MHMAAAVPNAMELSDIQHFLKEDDILVGRPLNHHDGHIALPPGPGLGVELSEDAVSRSCVSRTLIERYCHTNWLAQPRARSIGLRDVATLVALQTLPLPREIISHAVWL